MTDEHPEGTEIGDRSRVVEGFLSALHDEDWHAASLAMDENIVYHNVGYPIIKGRRGVMRFWRRIFDRPSGGFEAKIHRIAVEGVSVLTERRLDHLDQFGRRPENVPAHRPLRGSQTWCGRADADLRRRARRAVHPRQLRASDPREHATVAQREDIPDVSARVWKILAPTTWPRSARVSTSCPFRG